MWKIIGMSMVFLGVAGGLYHWTLLLKEKENRVNEFVIFLNRATFAMQNEKIRIIEYFLNYCSQDQVLDNTLQKVAKKLQTNTYSNGQMAWEEALVEEEQNWNMHEEMFKTILQSGSGFFGRCREENVSFLQKSRKELEIQMEKMKEKNLQERKVWVPVGMLGTVMIMILFI